MTIGKSVCRASKKALIAIRDMIDKMIKNYTEYESGDWKTHNKDYKYKMEWEKLQRGNDYY